MKGPLSATQGKVLDLAEKKYFGELDKDVGFSGSIFMVFGLPTQKVPGNPAYWKKDTKLYQIIFTRHPDHEIPYGCYARMNQIFIDTEVVTKKTNVIEVGRCFNDYIKNLGYTEGFANRALGRQLINYVTSNILVKPKTPDNRIIGTQTPVSRAWDIYFDYSNPNQLTLSKGQILIDPQYAKYIQDHAVPLDMNLVRAFKRNPLALDFYRYLAYRNNGLNRTISFPDTLLFEHLGTTDNNPRKLRLHLKSILAAMKIYWPVQAKLEDGFFELKPSPGPGWIKRVLSGPQGDK
jgi:hypothetical protein